VNKDRTYERLIVENLWIKKFWPNAVDYSKIKTVKNKVSISVFVELVKIAEPLAYAMQRWYMRGKISRETVNPTRAFFHPRDWGGEIEKKLKLRGLAERH